jgi:chromate reductase, NAD(P)H dehydrogenase (quinone)
LTSGRLFAEIPDHFGASPQWQVGKITPSASFWGTIYPKNCCFSNPKIMKYTIISGTNRQGSNTLKVARQYQEMLASRGLEVGLLSLEGLDLNQKGQQLQQLEQDVLIPTDKFIFVLPEYNGSYPGSLKTMIDMSDIRKVWWGKKALLTGVSTGRAGNLRGMDHLTGALNYLKVHVHHNKLPISSVDKLLNGAGEITDRATITAMEHQVEEFLAF